MLAIGAELLVGETRDTNSGDIATYLTELGVEVRRMTQLPDELAAITDWMRENKRLAAEPGDLKRIMAPEFLRKVAPGSVRGF